MLVAKPRSSRAPTARAYRVRRLGLHGVIVLLARRMIEKVIEEEIGHALSSRNSRENPRALGERHLTQTNPKLTPPRLTWART